MCIKTTPWCCTLGAKVSVWPVSSPPQHLPQALPKSRWRGRWGCPLTVSSVQMECTWVPNITDVKMRKSSASKHSKMRRITVVGGEKELHSTDKDTG